MIDIHSHILFGMDDGALNFKQSKEIMKKLYDEGIRTIIGTPNYSVGCVNPRREEIIKQTELLQEAANQISDNLNIYVGSELYYSDDSLEELRKKKIVTLADTRYVLVNLQKGIEYYELKTALHRLLIQGYYPILSQMDTYDCLYKNYKSIYDLIELGTCMEVDAMSLLNSKFSKKHMYLKSLLKYQLVHFIGSNAKTDSIDSYGIKDAYDVVCSVSGKKYAYKIFYDNGDSLLENQNIVRIS